MKKWIVVTTINSPTKAMHRIGDLVRTEGWRCIVVGDRKTPSGWNCPGIDFLSFDAQTDYFGELSSLIPANHYCRKNLGYLYAMEQGADVILETDDDNIPGQEFGIDVTRDVHADFVGGTRWINVYRYFSDALIWPRGNPLDTIHESGSMTGKGELRAPIQQYLANGDPDVDAIYRLLFKSPLDFGQREPVALDAGSWCSFNSQNTVFFREAFPLLYLPCHVSFRMTDIWRSFVAQAGLWSRGDRLVFRNATVVQERNQHDLMKDFRDEVDGYLNNDAIVACLQSLGDQGPGGRLDEVAADAWRKLVELGVVRQEELAIHEAWSARCRSA